MTPHSGEMSQEVGPVPEPYLPLADPFNRAEERAIINLVPRALQDAFLTAHRAKPHLFGEDEEDLYKLLKADGKLPTVTDNRLRVKFWHEYDAAQESGRKMNIGAVVSRVCSLEYLYSRYLQMPEKVAWLLTMPVAYENMMEEMLQFSTNQMRRILQMDDMLGGKPNVKLLELKAKIHFAVEMRQKGAVVQKNLNLNASVSADRKMIADMGQADSMDSIESRLKDLEARDRITARQEAMHGGKEGRVHQPVVLPADSDDG